MLMKWPLARQSFKKNRGGGLPLGELYESTGNIQVQGHKSQVQTLGVTGSTWNWNLINDY